MEAKPRGRGGKTAAQGPYVIPGSSPQLLSLLVCALCWPPCGFQTVLCDVTMEPGDEGAILTCTFSFDLRRIHSDVLIERFNESASIVPLAVCQRRSDGYQCTPKLSGVTFLTDNATASGNSSTEGSRRLSLGLPQSDLEAAVDGEVWTYMCNVPGVSLITCPFAQIDPPVPVLEWTASTSDSIEVSWDYGYYGDDNPIQDLAGVVLNYTYTQGSRDQHSEHLRPQNTSFLASGLLCGTLYHFVLRVTNTLGLSSDSQVLAARTNGSAPDMSARSPWVKETNVTTVTLSFPGAVTGATICPVRFYTVKYRRHGHVLWDHLDKNISADVEEMTVRELTPDSRYSMVVTAHTDAGTPSCNLHFATLPSPHETNRTKGNKDGGSGATTITGSKGTLIALALTLAAVVFIILGLIFYLCKRRVRRRGIVILNDGEQESTAGLDDVPFQDLNAMLQRPPPLDRI